MLTITFEIYAVKGTLERNMAVRYCRLPNLEKTITVNKGTLPGQYRDTRKYSFFIFRQNLSPCHRLKHPFYESLKHELPNKLTIDEVTYYYLS